MQKRLTMIAAMSENRVIGVDGGLPWKLPDEMAQFRAYTLGHPVIMGRVNFEAEGKPLPHRRNIVLTRNADWQPPEDATEQIEVCHTLDEALALVEGDPEPYIIGGAKIYELALPIADRIVLTTVHTTLDGDTFFPEFDLNDWTLTDSRHHLADARHSYAFTVNTYDRTH
ncbi:dihydrofolate reductase [Algisphaera agarilytica]|uniref:Dihydrofolate reductase n=1 Tax=Algisphaera agarilytica TaxID=1385975 RepID=A0A7X0H6S6_9BACT|nr:dihydrofolate reductase [Algisphaera agarilytica]MBB6428859.1 dihydrofolate reductase [Algisphaera agarilytica]